MKKRPSKHAVFSFFLVCLHLPSNVTLFFFLELGRWYFFIKGNVDFTPELDDG